MGYQTSYIKCKKCGGITIYTNIQYLMIVRKVITTTSCICKKDKK